MNPVQANILGNLTKTISVDSSDIDTILAKYFISHYYEAKEFNIYTIAEKCNVSRSSIRRYCQRIGFENFFNLKKAMIENNSKGDVVTDSAYRKNLTSEILAIIRELDNRMNTDEIGRISKRIKNSSNFYILAENTENNVSKEFQIELARCGKIVFPITTKAQFLQIKENFQKTDLIFSISITGKYAEKIGDYVKSCPSKSILITCNRLKEFTNRFTYVYFMSHVDQTANAQIYREFGVPYFLAILANNYRNLFLNPMDK